MNNSTTYLHLTEQFAHYGCRICGANICVRFPFFDNYESVLKTIVDKHAEICTYETQYIGMIRTDMSGYSIFEQTETSKRNQKYIDTQLLPEFIQTYIVSPITTIKDKS